MIPINLGEAFNKNQIPVQENDRENFIKWIFLTMTKYAHKITWSKTHYLINC